MKKKHLTLTRDQRDRGIVFSSELKGEGMDVKIHEVHKDDEDKDLLIERLNDDNFFNDSPYEYNEIRS